MKIQKQLLYGIAAVAVLGIIVYMSRKGAKGGSVIEKAQGGGSVKTGGVSPLPASVTPVAPVVPQAI